MGKSKSKASTKGGNSDWESASSTTTCTNWSEHPYGQDDEPIDGFEQALDDIMEKRGATREKAYKALLGYLREEVRQDDAEKNQITITTRCTSSIKRGSETEAVLACQVLGHLLITLPEPSESQFKEPLPELLRAAKFGKTAELRAAAIDTMGMACFIAADDDFCCTETMEELRSLWAVRDAKVAVAALKQWELLLSRLDYQLNTSQVEEALSSITRLIHGTNADIRNAAGQVLGTLYHESGLEGLFDKYADLDDDYVSNPEDDEDSLSVGSAGSTQHSLGEVVGRLRKLAASQKQVDNLRQSKKGKAEQRATFRSVLERIEGQQVKAEKIKLQHGDVLVVDSVRGQVMINAMRKYLAGGFQAHLQSNPQLHAIFDFTPTASPPTRLSALEKRHLRSPSSQQSKNKTYVRANERNFKAARHTGHCHEDDY